MKEPMHNARFIIDQAEAQGSISDICITMSGIFQGSQPGWVESQQQRELFCIEAAATAAPPQKLPVPGATEHLQWADQQQLHSHLLSASSGGSSGTAGSASPVMALSSVDRFGDSGLNAAAEPSWRQRSVTPVDQQPCGRTAAAAGEDGTGPITPAAAPSHAARSPAASCATTWPAVVAGSTAEAASAASAAQAQDAAAAAAQRAASAAALWRRVRSFMHCVAASPLVQSALLSLEISGTHPAAGGTAGTAGMRWTLAQMLALYLRAGYTQAEERVLLAALWLIESAESVWRSPATACLNDYIRHLAVFSPQAVVELTADWRNSFSALRKSMVDAQMDLLKRLDWRVCLKLATEIEPCHNLLFHLGRTARQQQKPRQQQQKQARPGADGVASAAAAAEHVPSSRELWSLHMRQLCATIKQQAVALAHRLERQADGDGDGGKEGLCAAAKRPRT